MAIIITVPPYAAGQYGWDPLEKDCWYTNDNRTQRIIWQVTTQMMWTAMLVIGEIISSCTVMFFMLKHHGRMERIFRSTRSFSTQASNVRSGSESLGETEHYHGKGPVPQVVHANKYVSIVVRVALYPLASCLVNFLSVITALHSTIANDINDSTDYKILLLSDFLYGGRAIVYALLAASDPELVRAVKTYCEHVIPGIAFWKTRERQSFLKESTASHPDIKNRQLIVHIELSTIQKHNPVNESDVCSLERGLKDVSDGGASASNGKQQGFETELHPLPPLPTPDTPQSNATRDLEGSMIYRAQRREEERMEQQDYFKKQI